MRTAVCTNKCGKSNRAFDPSLPGFFGICRVGEGADPVGWSHLFADSVGGLWRSGLKVLCRTQSSCKNERQNQ